MIHLLYHTARRISIFFSRRSGPSTRPRTAVGAADPSGPFKPIRLSVPRDGEPVPYGSVRTHTERGRTMCAPTALFGHIPNAGRGTRPLRQDRSASTNPGCAVGADDHIGPFKPIRFSVSRDGEPVPCGVIRTYTERGRTMCAPTALFGRVPKKAGRLPALHRCSAAYRTRDGGSVPYGGVRTHTEYGRTMCAPTGQKRTRLRRGAFSFARGQRAVCSLIDRPSAGGQRASLLIMSSVTGDSGHSIMLKSR